VLLFVFSGKAQLGLKTLLQPQRFGKPWYCSIQVHHLTAMYRTSQIRLTGWKSQHTQPYLTTKITFYFSKDIFISFCFFYWELL